MSTHAFALSGPVEDYHKTIYELERVGDPASTNDIAVRLAISPASVSGMVRRLADQGLHLSEGQIVLTGSPMPLFPVAPGSHVIVKAESIGESRAEFIP